MLLSPNPHLLPVSLSGQPRPPGTRDRSQTLWSHPSLLSSSYPCPRHREIPWLLTWTHTQTTLRGSLYQASLVKLPLPLAWISTAASPRPSSPPVSPASLSSHRSPHDPVHTLLCPNSRTPWLPCSFVGKTTGLTRASKALQDLALATSLPLCPLLPHPHSSTQSRVPSRARALESICLDAAHCLQDPLSNVIMSENPSLPSPSTISPGLAPTSAPLFSPAESSSVTRGIYLLLWLLSLDCRLQHGGEFCPLGFDTRSPVPGMILGMWWCQYLLVVE